MSMYLASFCAIVTYNKLVIAKLSYALIFTFSQCPVKLYFQKYLSGYCQTKECQQECESRTIPGSFEFGLWVWVLCKRQGQPLLSSGSWSVCQRNQAQGQANTELTSSSLSEAQSYREDWHVCYFICDTDSGNRFFFSGDEAREALLCALHFRSSGPRGPSPQRRRLEGSCPWAGLGWQMSLGGGIYEN